MKDDPTIPARSFGSERTEPSREAVGREPMPGAVGGCRILRVLGEGGMGVVYLARQEKFDRDVALKVTKNLDPSARQRFWREAKLAGSLAHPNIVQVFDVGEEERTMFLVMELVDGMSLAEKIRAEGPIPEATAVAIVAQVARALQFAHEKGVVHRDVKPGNILLNRQGLPKLTDLGLARHLFLGEGKTLTESGVVLGSVAYMSPEQVADPRKADARSDIYSLGATLYHALCGVAPFEADSIITMACRHAQEPRPDPRRIVPAISERTVQAFRRMMAIEPKDRFASMGEVVEALGQAAGFSTTVGSPAGPVMGIPVRRGRPGVLAAVVAGLLLAVAGAAWMLRPGGGAPLPECRGKVERLDGGRVRFSYDFVNAAESQDWLVAADSDGRQAQVAVRDGQLCVTGGSPAVVRFRHDLRVERIRVRAVCPETEGTPHINVYLNTQWQGNWEGNGGVACIMRGDGLLFYVDGQSVQEGVPPELRTGRAYEQEIVLGADGRLGWVIDGVEAYRADVQRVAGRSGSVLLGAYAVPVRFDSVEIVGVPVSAGGR